MIANIIGFGFLSGGSVIIPEYLLAPPRPDDFDATSLAAGAETVPGFIFTTDFGGKQDLILSGLWEDGVGLNAIAGTRWRPKRISNADENVLLSSPDNDDNNGMYGVNTPNNIDIWGKDKDAPLRLSGGDGHSGFSLLAHSSGVVARLTNVSIEDVGFSGLHVNHGSGSSVYEEFIARWVKVKGAAEEGEVVYFGNTGGEFSVFNKLILIHIAGAEKGRDGLQIGHVNNLFVYNNTYKDVGLIEMSQQDHLLQINDSNGVVENCIFDGGGRAWNIFTHGVTIKNCYFNFNKEFGFIGRTDNLSFYPTSRHTGEPLVFEDCIIEWSGEGALAYVTRVQERIADVEFKNCIFVGNITALYDDQRAGGHSNQLIGGLETNGNSKISSIDELTYVSEDLASDKFLAVNSGLYYNRRMGALLAPETDLQVVRVEYFEPLTDITYNTPFAELDLPESGLFMLQDGYEYEYPITWNSEDYDPESEGEQTITGVPDLPDGVLNDFGIEAKISVTVLPEPTSSKTILISLKGTGSSPYVGSGNWNHVRQNFGSGALPITGNDENQSLASLRTTDGDLTGYGVSVSASHFSGSDTLGMNSDGAYPANANRSCWVNPGSTDAARTFMITGLNDSIAYTFKLLASKDTGVTGDGIVSYSVSGASGGGTVSDFESKGNVNTVHTFDPVLPSSGIVTITVIKRGVTSGINVVQIDWTES